MTLRLHRRVYRGASIRVAKDAFAELATITLSRDGDYTVVGFKDVDPDVSDVIVQEFANYALAESIEARGHVT